MPDVRSGRLVMIGSGDDLGAAAILREAGPYVAVVAFEGPEPLRAIARALFEEHGVEIVVAEGATTWQPPLF